MTSSDSRLRIEIPLMIACAPSGDRPSLRRVRQEASGRPSRWGQRLPLTPAVQAGPEEQGHLNSSQGFHNQASQSSGPAVQRAGTACCTRCARCIRAAGFGRLSDVCALCPVTTSQCWGFDILRRGFISQACISCSQAARSPGQLWASARSSGKPKENETQRCCCCRQASATSRACGR